MGPNAPNKASSGQELRLGLSETANFLLVIGRTIIKMTALGQSKSNLIACDEAPRTRYDCNEQPY